MQRGEVNLMPRRTGTTLIEVLIAIFVMAIGLIALLTLFPIGALRMARAIQDDKCATAAANASAVATMLDVRNDLLVKSPGYAQGGDLFNNFPNSNRLPADPDGPSYPVYADPVGFRFSLPTQNWVAGYGEGIARTTTSFTPGTTDVYRWFTLSDDWVWDTDENSTGSGGLPFIFGRANVSRIPVIRRDIRYSWAYLLQRPRTSDPSIVTCSVVVYNKRPLSLSASLSLAENYYPATFNIASSNPTFPNTITVDLGTKGTPNVRTGDWLLDCSKVQTTNALGQSFASCHGYFYRVVGVNEVSPSVIRYEVQQPIRGFPLPAPNPPTFGTIMVLEGVADVYDRGVDRKPD
jgi:hypothetical protein